MTQKNKNNKQGRQERIKAKSGLTNENEAKNIPVAGVNKFVQNNQTLNLIPTIFLALLTAVVFSIVFLVFGS